MLISLKNATIALPERPLLTDVDFHVDAGEFVYIVGKVGSGKSSLLRTLYAECPIEADEAIILDNDLCRLKRKHIPALRRRLGIVFQDFKLLSDRTVGDNLRFVLRATGWKRKKEREERLVEVLGQVGLADRINAYPHELSGGEQQRVAIARALLNRPEIIMADEPTGNLDQETGEGIMRILRSLLDQGTAVVMVTHNLTMLQTFPGIVYRCCDGKVEEVTAEYNTPITLTEEEETSGN